MNEAAFSQQVLGWFEHSGRKDLPWQQDISPYRVWVSEIMLQQTQVKTVIPYFQRFMEVLPSVTELANADEDQVLHLWTGLGYYARARNLHKAARIVANELDGQFPDTVEALSELPGIGRSTAGAIVSIAFKQPAAILDGNVKRVLARYAAIEGWPGQTKVLKQLWELAENLTPGHKPAEYSQAMMDLGATLCLPRGPLCVACPVQAGCQAYQLERQEDFPGRKPRKTLPVKTTIMLMACNASAEAFLARRPAEGIWGGLWSFPEFADMDELDNFCLDSFGVSAETQDTWDTYRHTFSHYHLDITPVRVTLPTTPTAIMEGAAVDSAAVERAAVERDGQLWYNTANPEEVGLAAPVAKLLKKLAN